MKNMKTFKINLIIAAWFAVMLIIATLVTRCKSSGHACDDYWKVNTLENNDIASK